MKYRVWILKGYTCMSMSHEEDNNCMMFLQIMQYIGVSFFWKFELTSYEMYFN